MASDTARAWNQAQSRMLPGTHGGSRSKLTPQQREEIRQRLAGGVTDQVLAAEYGVSASTIRHYR